MCVCDDIYEHVHVMNIVIIASHHGQSRGACSEVTTLSLLCFNPVPLLFGRLTWLLGFSFLTNWCPKTALLI